MKSYILFILPFFFVACRFASIGDAHSGIDFKIPDIAGNNINKLLYLKKKNIIDELNIKSIESGVDSLEIRLWAMAGSARGGELYIIRKTKYKWNCYHYWFIERVAEQKSLNRDSYTLNELADAGLDTFWIKKEVPRYGWNRFLTSLNNSEIYNLDSFEGVSLEVIEKINSYSFMIEYATKNKYRLYWYNCSDIFNGCRQCEQMIGVLNVFNTAFNFSNSLLGNYRCRR